MQISRSPLILIASVAFAVGPMVACGGAGVAANPGGTLPPIFTTTTLSAAETTFAPFVEVYKLKAGDNLGSVARDFNVPLDVLIEYNSDTLGANPSNLPIGTEILIPPHRYIETLPPTTSTTLVE